MTTAQQTEQTVISRIAQMQEYRGATNAHLMRVAGIRTHQTWNARMNGKHPFTLPELIAITTTLGYPFAALSAPEFDPADFITPQGVAA